MPKERVIKIVRLSFDPAYEDDPTPHVVIYNPEMLTPAAFSQVTRFGIGHSLDRKAIMSDLPRALPPNAVPRSSPQLLSYIPTPFTSPAKAPHAFDDQ